MLRLTTVLLALVHVLGASAYAEDEMAMMAQEARLRILSRLEAKKIPEGIANAVARLTDNDSPTREGAAKALLENPDRANVITALIAAIHEDNNNKQPNCGTVLVKLGADVVPALIAALQERDARPRVTWALGQLGEPAVAAIPALVQLVKSADAIAANDAAVTLGQLGRLSPEILPALIEALKHENAEVRAAAAASIKQIGPTAEHIPLLLPALKDPYMKVRSTIILTFGYMGAPAKSTIPAIISHLKDENSWVRMHAAASLARFDKDAKDAVPALREALRDEVGVVKGTAAAALARIHPSAEIVPDLISLLQDKNARVRTLTEEAIVTIGPVAIDDLKSAAEVVDDAALKTNLDDLVAKIKANEREKKAANPAAVTAPTP